MNHVRASTLILVGQNDWVCPPGVAERIHGAIAGPELTIFAKTGHFPWIEDPEHFFASVTAFLEPPPSST